MHTLIYRSKKDQKKQKDNIKDRRKVVMYSKDITRTKILAGGWKKSNRRKRKNTLST